MIMNKKENIGDEEESENRSLNQGNFKDIIFKYNSNDFKTKNIMHFLIEIKLIKNK